MGLALYTVEGHTCTVPSNTCLKDTDKDGHPDCYDTCPNKKDKNAAKQALVAHNKGKITASSQYSSGYAPIKAIDTSTTSYWCTKKTSKGKKHWINLNLGKKTAINGLQIAWAYAPSAIVVKLDGKTVYSGKATKMVWFKLETAKTVWIGATSAGSYVGIKMLDVHACPTKGGECIAGESKDTDKDGYPDCADACPKKKDVNMATLPSMKSLKGSIKSSVGSWAASYSPEKAVDNNGGTYWCSPANKASATLTLDLGQPIKVNGVEIKHAYFAKTFDIFASTNGKSYKKVASGTAQGNGQTTNTIIKGVVTARYIQLRLKAGGKYQNKPILGIYTVEVHTCTVPSNKCLKDTDKDGHPDCYDTCPKKKDKNAAKQALVTKNKGKITASSQYSSGYAPIKAIDTSTTSYWCTKKTSKGKKHWINLNLGKKTAINGLQIAWAYAPSAIVVKLDGKTVYSGKATKMVWIKQTVTAKTVWIGATSAASYVGIKMLDVHTCS